MVTSRSVVLVLAALFGAASCGAESEAPVVDDQSWDDLSAEERMAHLVEKMDGSLEGLEEASDAESWHAASDAAIDALSCLRVELRAKDPEHYASLEAEVERLTGNVPVFARVE